MEHDFDKALDQVNEWNLTVEDLRKDCLSNNDNETWAKACKSLDTYKTIQFALRFTKAALSGEVSEAVYDAGYNEGWIGHDEQWEYAAPDSTFTAMCQQLAKEIG